MKDLNDQFNEMFGENKAVPPVKNSGVGTPPGGSPSNMPGTIQSGGIHIILDDDRRQCLRCGEKDHETRECDQ